MKLLHFLLLTIISFIICGSADCGNNGQTKGLAFLDEEDLDIETLNREDCPEFWEGCLLTCSRYDPSRYGNCHRKLPVQFTNQVRLFKIGDYIRDPNNFWVYQNDSKAYQSGCLRGRGFTANLPAFQILRDVMRTFSIPIPGVDNSNSDSFFHNGERGFPRYTAPEQYVLAGITNYFTILRNFGRMCILEKISFGRAKDRFDEYFSALMRSTRTMIGNYQRQNNIARIGPLDEYNIRLRLEGIDRIALLYFYSQFYGLSGQHFNRLRSATTELTTRYLRSINEIKDETLCFCEDYRDRAFEMYNAPQNGKYPYPPNQTFRSLVDRRNNMIYNLCTRLCF